MRDGMEADLEVTDNPQQSRVRGALDGVRTTGRRVVASCWYVAQFIDEHPEYRDLTAA